MSRFLVAIVALCLCGTSAYAQILLDDFANGIRKNPYGGPLWEAYLGEDRDQSSSIENGAFKVIGSKSTGCGTNGCGVYWHFMPYPYVAPGGFVRAYVKGTWDANANRLKFKFKCSKTVGRYGGGVGNYYVGTYVKTPSNTNHSNQGQHYYHNLGSSVHANRWSQVEVTRRPQHRVGASGSTNWPDDPEWSDPTTGAPVHYFDGLTRWYFDTTGGDTWAGQTCSFDDFTFATEPGEADNYISGIVSTHNGTRYEVSWNSPKNVQTQFEVRYSTVSMKANGFASGTPAGTVSAPGNDYTVTYWDSPNMTEKQNLYVAIRPTSQSIFTEVHIPAMNSTPSTGSPCDLDGSGSTDSKDVQMSIDSALGKSSSTQCDLDGNGKCDVVDVQRLINASNGGSCRTGI